MRPDEISFGLWYIKSHRENHFELVTTRKMRELAKLLIELTIIRNSVTNFFGALNLNILI